LAFGFGSVVVGLILLALMNAQRSIFGERKVRDDGTRETPAPIHCNHRL